MTDNEKIMEFCKRWCANYNRTRREKQMKMLAESNIIYKRFLNGRFGKIGVNDEIINALAKRFDHPPGRGEEWDYVFDVATESLHIYHRVG